MRENRTYGSEGGEAKSLPYPLSLRGAGETHKQARPPKGTQVRLLRH